MTTAYLTPTPERPVAVLCDRCALPDSASLPLAIVGHRLLCGDCAHYERISACRLFIASCTKTPEACPVRFQAYVGALSQALSVLEAHEDAAWWRRNASAGAGWLLTYGAAEVLALNDEWDAGTFEEDSHAA